MPSGLRKTSGNNFEIYYEQPWGGVASDKSYVDIEPNQLVQQQGVVVSSGKLEYFNLVADPIRFRFNAVITTAGAESFPYLIFELVGELFACDQYGYIYVYSNPVNPTVGVPGAFNVVTLAPPSPPNPVVATDGPWNTLTGGDIPTAVQVINGIAYIAVYSRHTTYTFDGNVTFIPVSTYTAGQFMGVLDDYLLQFNTNNIVDGGQPNRVNWSGPGKFSTWDPAIDRTAGFNTLAAIEDQITGFLSYANVGVAISQKGLIELSPTGVAIGPFSFTALWTSEIGQGSIYPKSIVQYGQSSFLITDSGIYKVAAGTGLTDISGTAKRVIYSTIQNTQIGPATSAPPFNVPPQIAGTIMLYYNNSRYPTPHYIFVAIPESLNQTGTIVVWLLNLGSGIWQSFSYNVDNLVNKQYGTSLSGGVVDFIDINTFDVFPRLVPGQNAVTTFNNTVTLCTVRVKYSGSTKTLILSPYLYNNDGTTDIAANYAGNMTLVFRGEEIKIGREPTIRRIVIRAYGTGDLVCSINGTSFGTITLDGTSVAKTYKNPRGIYTGESPQLTITSINFKGVIEKVMLGGTFADGDID